MAGTPTVQAELANAERIASQPDTGAAPARETPDSTYVLAERTRTQPTAPSYAQYQALAGHDGVLVMGGADYAQRFYGHDRTRPAYPVYRVTPEPPAGTALAPLADIPAAGISRKPAMTGADKHLASDLAAAAVGGAAARVQSMGAIAGEGSSQHSEVRLADVRAATWTDPRQVADQRVATLRSLAWPTGSDTVYLVPNVLPHNVDTGEPVGLQSADGVTGPLITAALAGTNQALSPATRDRLYGERLAPGESLARKQAAIQSGWRPDGYAAVQKLAGPYETATTAARVSGIPWGVFDLHRLVPDNDVHQYIAESVEAGAPIIMYAKHVDRQTPAHPLLTEGDAYLIGLERPPSATGDMPGIIGYSAATGRQLPLTPGDVYSYFTGTVVQAVPDWAELLRAAAVSDTQERQNYYAELAAAQKQRPGILDTVTKTAAVLRIMRLMQ